MRRPGLFIPLVLALLVLANPACRSARPDYPPLIARLFLEVRPGETGVPLQLPKSGVIIPVESKPVIGEYDFARADVVELELGRCLRLQLTPAAARDLYRLSVANLGRRLVLLLNDAPGGVHRIEQPMADGTVLVFVETPDTELAALAVRVNRTSSDIAAAGKKSR